MIWQRAFPVHLPKSTLFRHFSDKRELLVAQQATLSELFEKAIVETPPDADVKSLVQAALISGSEALGPPARDLGPKLRAAIAAHQDLQDRDTLKTVGLTRSISTTLVERGEDVIVAHIAGELAILAFKRGYWQWVDDSRSDEKPLSEYVIRALEEIWVAGSSMLSASQRTSQ